MTIAAKYVNGVFRPLEDVKIKEGTVVEVLVPVEQQAARKRPIKDLPFYGIWKDRADIGAGVRLREQAQGQIRAVSCSN